MSLRIFLSIPLGYGRRIAFKLWEHIKRRQQQGQPRGLLTMRFSPSVSYCILLLSILLLPSCKLIDDIKDLLGEQGLDPSVSPVSCAIALSDPLGKPVASGSTVSIKIQPLNGYPPYQALGVIKVIEEGEIVEIQKSFTNTTSDDRTEVIETIVTDSKGNNAQCKREIIVLAENNDPDPDPDPELSLAATPSASVTVENTITITPTALNLGSTPTFEYLFAQDAGIGFEQTASGQGIFRSLDNQPRTFEVELVARQGSVEVSSTITLEFTATAQGNLNCDLTVASGNHYVNDQFAVTVSSSDLNAGEEIVIIEANPGVNGFIASHTAGEIQVSYQSSGIKQFTVKAGTTQGRSCNLGNTIQASVTILSQTAASLTCQTIVERVAQNTSQGPVHIFRRSISGYYEDRGRIRAEVSGASGAVHLVGFARSNLSVHGYHFQVAGDSLARDFVFTSSGWTQIAYIIRDQSGRTVTCQPSGHIYVSY